MSFCSVLQKPELDSLLPFPCYALTMQTFWKKLTFPHKYYPSYSSDGLLMVCAQRLFIFIFNFKYIVEF